jgi:hypothetical protein
MRMGNSNREIWEKIEIDQCITFFRADMGKHENLLIAASYFWFDYFWFDTLNTFLFGNGPMIPTLLDVLMLMDLVTIIKSSHQLATKEVKGWNGYITEHARTGIIDHREHTTFLNMWLEKFIFCGSTCGPTTNM